MRMRSGPCEAHGKMAEELEEDVFDGDEEEEEEETEDEEESDDSEFSDPEGFVDDIDDDGQRLGGGEGGNPATTGSTCSDQLLFLVSLPELLADLLSKRPVEDMSLDSVIVVDNAPQVGPDRMNKLKTVLKKVFGRFGTVLTEYYPVDEDDMFKG